MKRQVIYVYNNFNQQQLVLKELKWNKKGTDKVETISIILAIRRLKQKDQISSLSRLHYSNLYQGNKKLELNLIIYRNTISMFLYFYYWTKMLPCYKKYCDYVLFST